MVLVFCKECGYRTYTQSRVLSQEFCENCGNQGAMKEVQPDNTSQWQPPKTWNCQQDKPKTLKTCEMCEQMFPIFFRNCTKKSD